MMKICLSRWLLGALCFVHTVQGAQRPIEEVKATTDKVLAILRDPNLQGDVKKSERRHLVRQELDVWFDWTAIARGCLGQHWAKRSRAEQQEFADLFSKLMETTYLDKLETYYVDLNKIDYVSERIRDNYASIKLIITARQVDHPVEYRMQKASPQSHWRIYDVLIEGVSLVKNYRDQFSEIIAKSSYEAMVSDLKAKVKANPSS